jgi:hypothetical protein
MLTSLPPQVIRLARSRSMLIILISRIFRSEFIAVQMQDIYVAAERIPKVWWMPAFTCSADVEISE